MSIYFVTGAASGIGKSVAHLAMKEGHKVVCFDRDVSALQVFAGQANALVVGGDVSDPESCAAAVSVALSEYGRIDGLSHNAGIQRYGSAESTTDDLWNEVMSVNLTGAFYMARAVLPELIKTSGSIAFMGSVQSLASQENVAAYTASKHGLLGLANSIAMDFAPHGVRCNTVAPGAVQTPMLEWAISLAADPDQIWRTLRKMHPMGDVAQPEEVAEVVLFLLSNKARFITGEVLRVDGGMLTQIAGSPKEIES